jgi:hypothetical protein
MKRFIYIVFINVLILAVYQQPYDYTHRLANMQAGESLCNEPGENRVYYKVYSNSYMNGHTIEILPNVTLEINGDLYKQGGEIIKVDATSIIEVTGQIFD